MLSFWAILEFFNFLEPDFHGLILGKINTCHFNFKNQMSHMLHMFSFWILGLDTEGIKLNGLQVLGCKQALLERKAGKATCVENAFGCYKTSFGYFSKDFFSLGGRRTLFENHQKSRISILAFSTDFCLIKIDLSGNTVWPKKYSKCRIWILAFLSYWNWPVW